MSYTKTQWLVDDTVSAQRLNKIENALANHDSCVFEVRVVDDVIPENSYLNKTWNEISAAASDKIVIFVTENDVSYWVSVLGQIGSNTNNYWVLATDNSAF